MDEQPFTPDWFSKPGDSLRSLMQRRSVTAGELARKLEGGMTAVRGILNGSTAIDLDLAKALANAVGGTFDFWLKRQGNYDIALDRAVSMAEEYESGEWLERVPAPGATTGGRLTDAKRRAELRRRLVFFNVANMKSWEARYGRLREDTRFRNSPSFISNNSAILLWLRKGELEADIVATQA